MAKVIKLINPEEKTKLIFDDGHELYSEHQDECCESHYLDFSNLTIDDFDGLEFDLTSDFFERAEGYGIRLLPVNGLTIAVPAYSQNSGAYSDELSLVLVGNKKKTIFDITECQEEDRGRGRYDSENQIGSIEKEKHHEEDVVVKILTQKTDEELANDIMAQIRWVND